jgi:hypothetical protein
MVKPGLADRRRGRASRCCGLCLLQRTRPGIDPPEILVKPGSPVPVAVTCSTRPVRLSAPQVKPCSAEGDSRRQLDNRHSSPSFPILPYCDWPVKGCLALAPNAILSANNPDTPRPGRSQRWPIASPVARKAPFRMCNVDAQWSAAG